MKHCSILFAITVWFLVTFDARAQGTAFTYQGRLNEGANPASGIYDFQFTLYDSADNLGGIVAGPVTHSATAVNNGLFTATLDFGANAFNGANRWLEIRVRAQGGAFATLSPRQAVTPVPYATYAMTPAGPQGPSGPLGPAGVAGPKGEKGDSGSAGPKGANGDTGLAGPKGDSGLTGSAGPKGDKGDSGLAGPVGATGPQGQIGSAGATGPKGDKGDKGDTGPAGPQGIQGLIGPPGPEGPLSPNVALRAGGNVFSESQIFSGPVGVGTAAPISQFHSVALSGNGVQGNSSDGRASGVYGENNGQGYGVAGRTSGFGTAVFGDNMDPAGWAGFFKGQVAASGGMNIDQVEGNDGTLVNGLSFGLNGSEGIGSKRNVGGNQFGLDFYTGFVNRMSIFDNGNIAISSPGSLNFGAQTRQMLNLFNAEYGIGVQTATEYFRSAANFRWLLGGVHKDSYSFTDFGSGGTELMFLDSSGNLTLAGTLNSSSDRNAKQDFEPVNGREVLEKVAALPLVKWSFKTDASTRHIGPMAQDFYDAFKVGADDKHIATVDADGVALAAIQGLNQKVEEKDAKIAELEKRLSKLEQLISDRIGGDQ